MPVTVRGTDILMNSGAVIQSPPGTAPGYVCRAWVNFDGTGTVAIRAAGNVSSITDNGTGDYTVNFTTAMVDANYAPTVWGQAPTGVPHNNWIVGTKGTGTLQTSACNITATNGGSSILTDLPQIGVAIFR